ncbi:RagB/SusD family nutrient uptake outer membrane protein [Lacibacter sediminis]|uniref:RagB/SusD family nutrient uptake outer membrane protein n=1 Tax=Lacibacter sediminis TaxID=2760713 RepID=A0A7G5XF75_9BACT|nr:RagB/SusD family nutrient uptake outer membrane protein [Lacibacter sediminis]QNA44128.1 RagB/SusD family nutrient uptake outer membrane protein [Lacibacter sediminis]
MKLRIMSFLVLIAIVTSCNKQKLEPIPQTVIPDILGFADSSKAVQQVFGLYSGLKSGQMYAGRYQVYQDVRGEEFINRTNNAVTAWLTWQFNLTASANEVQGFWASVYNTINRCNIVINEVPGAPLSASLKSSLIAEAKVVRATCYFMLMQLYARPYTDGNGSKLGVILKLAPEKQPGENNQTRATAAEIYTQILKDLNEAEPDLPSTYGNATANTTRAHKNTAIALKTRVYLNMGNWASVITEGNKLVPNAAPWVAPSGVANSLQANVATVYTNYTNSEMILSMPFTALDVPGTQNGLGWYYNPGPNGGGEFALNTTAPGIAANTSWRDETLDARRALHIVSGGQRWLRKFPNPNNAADWSPVIRYAEVMLNLAEGLARNEAGTAVNARALTILNAIRKRSDPTILDFTPATKDELVALILTERRIELLGEGFRTSDIARTGSPFPAKGTVGSVAASADQYIWPISIAELLVNKTCQQNPGY